MRSIGAVTVFLTLALGGPGAASADEASLSPKEEQGKRAFSHTCVYCHGPGVWGTNRLAKRIDKEHALLESRTDLVPGAIQAIVRNGIGSMPPLRKTELSDADLDAIAAYLTEKEPMKTSKREFVKAAGAVALAWAVAPAAPAAIESFDVVVYNNWFPQAHEFAARFPAARALAVGGDAGRLWYGTLSGLVNGGLRRIAGLTTHTDLLILETLAREAGLRVRSRRESGRLVSWVLI